MLAPGPHFLAQLTGRVLSVPCLGWGWGSYWERQLVNSQSLDSSLHSVALILSFPTGKWCDYHLKHRNIEEIKSSDTCQAGNVAQLVERLLSIPNP